MSKKCARCEKTVYPTEELKCLDKIWHKMCFKCQECGMTLNMKNYKGYDKLPYCNAHYPQTKHTAVADTPEISRISKNTKMQSNIKYHEEFEKMKGTKITVADDPETLRAKKNMEIASQVEYKGLRQLNADQEARRGLVGQDDGVRQMPRSPAAVPDDFNSPYSARNQPGMSTMYTQQGKEGHRAGQRVGSISDYDPMNDQWGSVVQQPYSSGQQFTETVAAPGGPGYQQQPQQQFRHPEQSYQPPPQQHQQQPPPSHNYRAPEPAYNPPEPTPAPAPSGGMMGKPMYKAMYDYEAQDSDEVGFREGDVIVDPEPIDEGWMMGTVKSTGLRGMLPSNYVERV